MEAISEKIRYSLSYRIRDKAQRTYPHARRGGAFVSGLRTDVPPLPFRSSLRFRMPAPPLGTRLF